MSTGKKMGKLVQGKHWHTQICKVVAAETGATNSSDLLPVAHLTNVSQIAAKSCES